MVRDDLPDELDNSLPPEDEGDAADEGIQGDDAEQVDEVEQPATEQDGLTDSPPLAEADVANRDAVGISREPEVGAPPNVHQPSAGHATSEITLGEALSLGMGQVPARRLPDMAPPVAIPPAQSVPVEAQPAAMSPASSALPPHMTHPPATGEVSQEKLYTYYEMRERIYNGESPPATDPRSPFFGMSPNSRSKHRRLYVEVEVSVANAERVAMIAVEKSKQELKQLLGTHMMEISEKFYAIRQTLRQLSRGY